VGKRYRKFKRFFMTPATAEMVVKHLVDKTLEHHARNCGGRGDCGHATSGTLPAARVIESGMHIGKRRAHLDIPDDPDLAEIISARLVGFSSVVGRAGPAFRRIAEEVLAWAHRSPLHRLAEAGLELDG